MGEISMLTNEADQRAPRLGVGFSLWCSGGLVMRFQQDYLQWSWDSENEVQHTWSRPLLHK